MSRLSIFSALFALPLVLAACAPEAPEPIRAAAVYDKLGNPGCVADGQIVFPDRVPGTAVQPPLYLPDCEELCDGEPIITPNGRVIDDCLPDPQRPPRDDSSSDDGDRVPDRTPDPTTPGTAPR